MWIFPHPLPIQSMRIFPHGNFPQNFKVQYKDIERVPVDRKYSSDVLMSIFGELKCSQVWGNLPLISTRMDSLHQQPASPGIPRRIHLILPAGQLAIILTEC